MNKSRIRIFVSGLPIADEPDKPDHYRFNFLKQFDFIFKLSLM